ncbi:molybdopterin synthase small subunit CnxG [Xylariaceae sp. FL0255]|nr:molybdopterin synthase small subunit CnxG [Xylariaceae sp. FL0255]
MSNPKPPPGHFRILYFASASTFTAKEHDDFPAPLAINKLFYALEEKYAGIKEKILSSCLVTINLDYVDVPKDDDDATENNNNNSLIIQEGDEVAIIPPVSSG